MKINTTSFDISDMTIPVKLYRDFPQILNSDSIKAAEEASAAEDATSAATGDGGTSPTKTGAEGMDGQKEEEKPAPAKRAFKKKTKLYYNNAIDYQEIRHESAKLRHREYKPWIFEDAHRDYSFVGMGLWFLNLLKGHYQQQDSQYVLFVFENDQFKVVPVDYSYKFNTRINYRTLTTDEAEQQLKKSGVSMDRWMMHKLNTTAVNQAQEAAAVNTMTVVRGEEDLAGDIDEVLFGEHFEDDEEYGQDIGEDAMEDDTEVQRRNEKIAQRLALDMAEKFKKKQETKDTTKLLKKMKEDFLDEDDEDEMRDPYAEFFGTDSSDEEPEETETKTEEGKKEISPPVEKKSSQPSRPTSNQNSRSSSPAPQSIKRKIIVQENASSSSLANAERPSKKVKSDKSSDVLTENEILQVFLKAPNHTIELRTLVEKFQKKLKIPENKELFKNTVMKLSIKDGDKKIRTLKPEYRN